MKMFISFAVGIGLIVLIAVMLTNRKSGHTIILNGKVTDSSLVTADALEGEIRTGLTVGSSLNTVNDFLAKREIEHSFVAPSKTVYAIVNDLKGGSMLCANLLLSNFISTTR